jgi:hypothetical protein
MLSCPACNYYFTDDELRSVIPRCPACRAGLDIAAFPALYRAEEMVRRLDAREDDARCAFHSGNQAESACARCGILICSVCAVPLGKQTVCPQCLDRSLHVKKTTPLSTRVAWDSLALMLVIHPLLLLFWWGTFFTACGSIVISIVFYNKPLGPVPRGKWRFTISIIVGLVWMSAWIVGGILFMDKLWPAIQENIKKS